MHRTAVAIIFTALILLVPFTVAQTTHPPEEDNRVIVVPDDFPTIGGAIENASDGDTVFVHIGTYNETVIITKAITLRGEDTNRTIINGNMTGTVIQILHSNVNVTGFTVNYGQTNTPSRYWIKGFPADWIPTWGEWDANQYAKESGHFIRYGQWRIAGIHLQNSRHCNIYGNNIVECGVGIWLWKSDFNNITGNVLERNDYGLLFEESADNLVAANTFQNNAGAVWFWQIWTYSSTYEYYGLFTEPRSVYNIFTQNNFGANQVQVESIYLTRDAANLWDDGVVGNYWSPTPHVDNDSHGFTDGAVQILGEHYTGGVHQKGEWVTEAVGEDHHPLMTPVNSTSYFTVYTPPTQPATPLQDTAFPFTAAAVVTGAVCIAAVLVYLLKTRRRSIAS